MTSTFVNDLRLNEQGTGDNSGSWGTVTNTNLELIGEALGFGEQQVFPQDQNADTTIADGASDPARAMYFRVTSAGNLTATRQMTILPNTTSRLMFIENATSGSQSILVKCGSDSAGDKVTIPTGHTKAVYLTGAAGSGVVVDAFAALSVDDLLVDDDLTVLDDAAIGGDLTVTGDLAVNGDTTTFSSANSQDPLLIIKNTTNDANGSRMHFVKDKGAAGADGDDIGIIDFISDDAAQAQTTFARIIAEVSESANTDEAGKLSFFVAESDGTTTALAAGLVLEGEHATNGEVDVTIAAGTASTTTVAGDLAVTTDATVGGTALVTGVLTTAAPAIINTASNGLPSLAFSHSNGSADNFLIGAGIPGTSNSGFAIRDVDASANRLVIDSSGEVGIGIDVPLHALHINASATGAIPTNASIGVSDANQNYFGFHNISDSATYSGIALQTRTSGAARWLIANEWQSSFLGDLVVRTRDGGSSSSEVLRINNNGNVGIKKDDTAIDTRLHIDNCPDNKVITFEQGGRNMAIGTFFSSGSTVSRFDFFMSDGNTNGGNNNRMSILSGGDVQVKTGNVVIATAGKGIDFAAQVPSQASGASTGDEVLNHYEQGTFTPALLDGTSVTVNDAHYTRIGRVVHIGMSIVGASNSSSAAILFTGLPFGVINGNDQAFGLTVANTTVGTDNIYFSFLRNTTNIGCATNANVDIATSVLSTKKLCISGYYFTS